VPIGTRDIDSTPPAKTRSSQPEATFCAATLTASRPEAQKRLSWTPATVSGRPALIAAEHDVVYPLGIELLVADQHLVHQADHEVDRLRRVQRAVALALATRCANRVEDQRVCRSHGRSPQSETCVHE
jgi:hypothetical protein